MKNLTIKISKKLLIYPCSIHCLLYISVSFITDLMIFFTGISCGQVPYVSGMKELTDTTKIYYNDSFIFECQESFTLMGGSNDNKNSAVVRCMDTGFWDLGDLRCIGMIVFAD